MLWKTHCQPYVRQCSLLGSVQYAECQRCFVESFLVPTFGSFTKCIGCQEYFRSFMCQVIGETCLVSTPLPLDFDPNTSFTELAPPLGRGQEMGGCRGCRTQVAPPARRTNRSNIREAE